MTATLDLAELTQRLRAAGFRSDTRQYLAAHELLLGLAAQGRPLQDDAARLASHLGPIFCTSPEEQSRFGTIVRDWLGVPAVDLATSSAALARRPFAPARRWRWLFPLLLALSLTALGVAATAWWYSRTVALNVQVLMQPGEADPVPAPQAQLRVDGEAVPLDAQAGTVISLRRGAPARRLSVRQSGFQSEDLDINVRTEAPLRIVLLPIPASRPAERALPVQLGQPLILKPPQDAPAPPVRDWRSAASVGAGCALILFASLYFWRQARLKRVLRRLPARRRPDFAALPAARNYPMDEPAVRKLATGMRRLQRESTLDIDVDASVRASARGAGLFAPVWTARRSIPEYLVLIERRSDNDHYAHWIDRLMQGMADNGVLIDRYWFVDDPRVCFRFQDDAQQRWPLATLLAQHHRASVLLFHQAARCVDALDLHPQPWLRSLAALPRRVLFTPEPPYHWNQSHHAVAADGFVVLPAAESGLAMLAALDTEWRIERLFPAPYARPFPPLLSADPAWSMQRAAPPADMQERLLKQLRAYLGPEALGWLAACALYPELSWDLTLDLAGVNETGDVRPLPMLARLPWLRHGVMPDWMRQLLLAQLSPAQMQRARVIIESRLERFVQHALATNTQDAPAMRIGRWVTPAEVVRSAPDDSPMRDAVFLGLVSGRELDAMTYDAPESLRGMFRKLDEMPGAAPAAAASRWWGAIRAWCDRHPIWMQAAAAGGVGALVFALTAAQLVAVPDPPDAIERAVTDMAFAPDGGMLLTATRGGNLRWWQLADAGQPMALLPYSKDRLGAMDLRTDGKAVVLGHADGRLSQHMFGGDRGFDISAHQGGVNAALFLQRGRTLASAGDDRLIRLWEAATGKQLGAPLSGHQDAITRLAAFDGRNRLASASADGTVRLWDMDRAAADGDALRGHQGWVLALAFSPDGGALASGDQTGKIRLWDVRSRVAREMSGHQAGVSALAFLGKGEYLVSGGLDKTVNVWNLGTGQVVQSLSLPDVVRQLSVNADRSQLATAVGEQTWVWPVMYAESPRPEKSPDTGSLPPARDAVEISMIDPPIKLAANLPTRVRLDAKVTVASADRGQLVISASYFGNGVRNCRGTGFKYSNVYSQAFPRGDTRTRIAVNLADLSAKAPDRAASVSLTASLNGKAIAFSRSNSRNPVLRVCYTANEVDTKVPDMAGAWCCGRAATRSNDTSNYEQKAPPSVPLADRWKVLRVPAEECRKGGGYPAASQAEAGAICEKLGHSVSEK